MTGVAASARLVVVYAALRSGTTMLRLMLDAHPQICCPGERDFMIDHLIPREGGYGLDTQGLQDDRIFRDSGLSLPQTGDGAAAFEAMSTEDHAKGDKTVHVLMLHRKLDRMLDLRPDIPVIHMLRDPRDVARSSIGMGWAGNTWYGVDHWIETETGWAENAHRLGKGQLFDLRYESLLEDPEHQLGALCRFLGVDYTPQMLAYSETSTYEPVDPSLAYQWKRKQSPAEVAELEAKLGGLLTASGYAPGPTAARPPTALRQLRLRVENRRHIWKTMFERFGYVDPILHGVAKRLQMEDLRRKTKRRLDEKRRAYFK